jgi:hypothetical protein
MVASPIPDVKSAIQLGNADALRGLLAKDPARANELIEWGKNCEIRTHPLHYVSDMLFDGTLERGREIPLIEVLLEAGADPNYEAENGETPLIGAASLNAEDVGLRLLEAGARPDSRGMWEATPLHWASNLGLERLVARLIKMGADLNLADTRYGASPVGWAIHGSLHSQPGAHQADFAEVVRLLVSAGAQVKVEWLADEKLRSDPAMWAVLSSKMTPYPAARLP